MATAVFGIFTRAASRESPGRTKPGAHWDPAAAGPLPITGYRRLLITEYRIPITVRGAIGVSSDLSFLNFGYWLLAIFRATGLGQ
jgi:hypothetical protein